MVLAQRAKWLYAVAGSGVVLGMFSYFQSEKKCAEMSWTTNFEPSVKWDYNWDRREPLSMIKPAEKENDPIEQNRINEQKVKVTPTATRHLFLIRHGQYNESAKADVDRRLTELGIKQAQAVGQRLLDLKFNYTSLVRSSMTRAIETSDIILKNFPDLSVKTDDVLREGAPIPPEPPVGYYKPESKKYFEDGARIEAAFRKYFHRAEAKQKSDSYEIIVCHANVIRYFVCRALQFPPEAWLRFSLHHCSITWVAIPPTGRVRVYAIGDSGHLSKDKMTTKYKTH
ncbi:serine/threonine-protein phosphatase PGAM5, mitochondrial-like [Uloborus diversus]|uniref:serine/threonine-protein phosphatase PGAM5, mitochondrial-like n=1 Tax=Uloborus diversus TaxID=327109 RepID=UPI0024090E4E|nr:serine/threonine-protein phosphatase PGAM5, mitochondrial-like [Uloborus diversus]XP_054718249.1 serine/threonine-protein phosphatase PGAM5, mitochondrial-like [Uloborus diversus]